MLPILIASLTILLGFAAWQWKRQQPAQVRRRRWRAIDGTKADSMQEVCEQVASADRLHVIVVEQTGPRLRTVAGAPWLTQFGILDEIAIRACMQSGEPTGLGAKSHGASDWLFVPIKSRGKVVAVAGVAGAYCRRRLLPEEPLMRSVRTAFETFVERHDRAETRRAASQLGPVRMEEQAA